jgi:hypothetical protein
MCPGRQTRRAVKLRPRDVCAFPAPASIVTFQGTADWFQRYIAALKQLLWRRGEECRHKRRLERDPDRMLTNLVWGFVKLKSAWSRCGVMEGEGIGEMPSESSSPPAVSGSTVPMTFVRIGRQPPRLAEVVEADYLDDETIAPMPAPPSRTVTMRFEWVGPRPPRNTELLPE